LEKSFVAVLGASPKRNRYSNMAVRRLIEEGYRVIPVNPGYSTVEGIQTVPSLSEIEDKVDTLTMYINPYLAEKTAEEIVKLAPRRVIFNPGSESFSLMDTLKRANIMSLQACTLVMLSTGQF